MDKRIYIIAILAVVTVILAVVRESGLGEAQEMSFSFSSKKEISGDRVSAMADTTLRALGVASKNIRPVKNRNDVRVYYPQGFDILNFISVMKDSLSDYDAEIISMENAKDKTSLAQVKRNDAIIKSFIFSKEPVQASQKGVSPSVPKKTTRR